MQESWVVGPSDARCEVRLTTGERASVPPGWVLVPPGDATFTKRIKAAGPTWTVKEKRGRRVFSQGVWAPGDIVTRIARELSAERDTPAYQKRLQAGRARRAKEQQEYVATFGRAVRNFLGFDARYEALEERMADLIAAHATPVGSGTVARTSRIPVERRAEAAVIAWMRHQTTAYDELVIPRKKGARRETRRLLAKRSRVLLERYRRGDDADILCPLRKALQTANLESGTP